MIIQQLPASDLQIQKLRNLTDRPTVLVLSSRRILYRDDCSVRQQHHNRNNINSTSNCHNETAITEFDQLPRE
jgi:hypothetical protein